MSEHVKLKRQKLLLLALKTAIGGSAAIYIAEKIGLQFAPSAGLLPCFRSYRQNGGH